jgi:hypothetical protein
LEIKALLYLRLFYAKLLFIGIINVVYTKYCEIRNYEIGFVIIKQAFLMELFNRKNDLCGFYFIKKETTFS